MTSRKLFQMIAQDVNALRAQAEREDHLAANDDGDNLNLHTRTEIMKSLAERVCDSLSTTNERFDRPRFMKACGFPIE